MESREKFPDRFLDFQFDGERITIPDLLDATSRVVAILREVDARSTGEESLDWVIRGLQYGSAAFEVVAEPKGAATPVWAPETVVRHFKAGIRQVIETGERPEFWTEAAMRRAYELTLLMNGNGIQGVRFGSKLSEQVVLTPEMRKPVREALEGRYSTIGSIEGRIEAISAHAEPYSCTVYTLLHNEAVRCYFGPEFLEDVHRVFKRRVLVRGIFRSRPGGEITSLRMSSVEVLPDADELPSIDEIVGILTNGE